MAGDCGERLRGIRFGSADSDAEILAVRFASDGKDVSAKVDDTACISGGDEVVL